MNRTINRTSILVVDDEDFSLAAVAKLLDRLGTPKVVTARDGNQAVEALVANEPMIELVLTDLNMSPVNGLQLLKQIRTGHSGIDSAMPVIMLTGIRDINLTAAAIELDVSSFVTKPVEARRLVNAIDQAIGTPLLPRSCAVYELVTIPDMEKMARIVEEIHLSAADACVEGAMPAGRVGDSTAAENSKLEPRRVRISPAYAGGQLTRDIVSGSGDQLMAAGTKLTDFMLQQLAELSEIDESMEYMWIVDDRT